METSQEQTKSISEYSVLIERTPKDIPEPPSQLVEFRLLSKSHKKDKEIEFFKQEFIHDYLEIKWKAELYNRDSFFFLHCYYLETENKIEKENIANRLDVFKNHIEKTDHPYSALRVNFDSFPYESKNIGKKEDIDWND